MASFLDKFLKKLKTERSVLGIDISSSSIKVIQVKKSKGQAVLETYGELALGPYTGLDRGQSTNLSSEKMSAALRDLLKESNVTTKNCGVAIPMSSSLINIIKMPDVGKKKLQTMVPIEMRKYVPVPISEVLVDWKIIPKNVQSSLGSKEGELANDDEEKKSTKNKVEVFVVAIHKETMENYTKIIKEAELNSSFFEIEIFSTIRSISVSPGKSIMVIDFGSGATKFYLIESGIVRESHIINRGSQNITQALSKALGLSLSKAEEMKRENGLLGGEDSNKVSSLVVDEILNEANRILLSYQKKNNKNIDKVILTGGGSILKGFLELARERLSTEVETSNPFSSLKYPAFLEKTLRAAGPEFAVAIGVALRKLEELG